MSVRQRRRSAPPGKLPPIKNALPQGSVTRTRAQTLSVGSEKSQQQDRLCGAIINQVYTTRRAENVSEGEKPCSAGNTTATTAVHLRVATNECSQRPWSTLATLKTRLSAFHNDSVFRLTKSPATSGSEKVRFSAGAARPTDHTLLTREALKRHELENDSTCHKEDMILRWLNTEAVLSTHSLTQNRTSVPS